MLMTATISMAASTTSITASTSVVLVDQTFVVPANDWRFVDLGLRQRTAEVKAEFAVQDGPPVQMLLMEHADLERLNRSEAHAAVAATTVSAHGRLDVHTPKPGNYVVVLENHSGGGIPAQVLLHVSVDFVEATQITPARQLTVVSLSLAVFLAIVSYSARRLWLGVKR